MSIDRVSCYVVTCGTCRYAFDEENNYITHFDKPDDALRAIVECGWGLTADGEPICSSCLVASRCEREGHDYTVWHPCACQGRIPDHAVFGCGLFRYCLDCNHHETRTLATLPTTAEPPAFGR